MGDSPEAPQSKKGGQFGFFQRLVALLFSTDDPDREKRRRLKQIANDLSRQKFKFYKPRSKEALGGLAKFFFEIYRVVGPAQTLLQGSENSTALKTIVIEAFLTEEQQEARGRFSEASIRSAAEHTPLDQLVADVKDAMGTYLSEFNATTVRQINEAYTLIRQLIAFARFDYYFVLRKFDSGMLEGAYTRPPRAEPINAEYVSDDIKDFLEVLLPLRFDADWESALNVLTQYRGVDVVPRDGWKKVLRSAASVARSGVLVQIVQHVDEEPQYKPIVQVEEHHIVEGSLNVLKTQVEAFMHKLLREVRTKNVLAAATSVFGHGPVHRARHYTDKANAAFTQRMIAGFSHTEAFNYLAAFLLDYFVADVRPLVSELLIVRAKWSDNTVSGQLSEAFYAILNEAEELEAFDRSVGDDGELGAKLRKASGPAKSADAASTRLLRQVIHDIDERAITLIKETAANLITVGRLTKTLIGDYERKSPEIIMNWRELDALSPEPMKERLVAIYKKIYSFVQLMQMFVTRRSSS